MKLRRSLGPSLRALLAHKLRAGLALASIAVGVASVVLTSAIGKGAEREVLRGIEGLGTGLLVVRPAQVKRLAGRKTMQGFLTTLDLADYEAIAELASVAEAAPGTEGMLRVKVGSAALVTKVLGTTPEFLRVKRFALQQGRFFDDHEQRNAQRAAVLGARVREKLFQGSDPIGATIRVRGVPFEVVGTLEPKGVQADGSDEDNQVLIPVQTALRRVFNSTWISSVFVSARDPRGLAWTEEEIAGLLRARHRLTSRGKADDFAVQNRTKFLVAQKEMAGDLALLTGGLAGTALLVGGAGILALMLLSVKERTGEIGLRLAVGATPRDILSQFLFEASLLALGGWAIGALIGALGATAVALGTAWKVALPLPALAGSIIMTAAIGLGFGALPARRASRMPPVQALAAR
jgi:putative ABC transport system permease protein